MNFIAIFRRKKWLPFETLECYDWSLSPNEQEVSLYVGSEPVGYEWESEHENPYLVLKNANYVAVYEAPKQDDDMPIYLYFG